MKKFIFATVIWMFSMPSQIGVIPSVYKIRQSGTVPSAKVSAHVEEYKKYGCVHIDVMRAYKDHYNVLCVLFYVGEKNEITKRR